MRLKVYLALGLLLLLAACGASQEPTEAPPPTETAEPTRQPQPSATPEPSNTPVPSNTLEPTDTPEPTSTNTTQPTDTPSPTNTPQPTSTPEPTNTPIPTDTPEPTETPIPTATPLPPPPSPAPVSGVLETFLSDARQSKADLWEIKDWLDRMEATGGFPQDFWLDCAPVHSHSIHQPVSTAPAADPDLAGLWGQYSAALASGADTLNHLVLACNDERAKFNWGERSKWLDIMSSAMSQAENVVRELEAMQ